MFLKETPHIKLRKANGLINIDYTACDILGLQDDSSTAAARSYNTIIGVYTRDSSGRKVYLETGYAYSTTTATKHKPRALSLAIYNDYKIVTGVHPEVLKNLYFYPAAAPAVDEIIKEVDLKTEIIKELRGLKTKQINPVLHARTKGLIKTRKKPESKNFKNGNKETIYYYRTAFNYIVNIYYHKRVHVFKQRLKTGNSKPGTANAGSSYNKYKARTVIDSY